MMTSHTPTDVQLSMAKYRDERARWVKENGSDRLRLAAKHGLLDASDNVYREERRNLEKPGWILSNELPAGHSVVPIHNPSLEALRELDEALRVDPSVKLVWVKWKTESASGAWQKTVIQMEGREALASMFISLPVYRWASKK